ncbi:50S ribosomal protein L21e [Candidatus Woesearchaeota archaeon]|nr:50S ribosomal protein L21e [Candidatus Woesearchaeota archaeon]
MAKRIGGSRRKTRSKLKKNIKQRGKISFSRYFQTFSENDRVYLNAEPAVQEGIYFPRFHNKVGTIKGKKGRCYEVQIKDGKKQKMLIVHPVHLKKCQE